MEIGFKEEQRFTQWWLWLILVVVASTQVMSIYKQFIFKADFDNNPILNTNNILMSFLIFGLIALFWLMRLKTTIDSQGIQMQFYPFVSKHIRWEQIKNIKVVNYGFEGGWGIRFWTKYGTIYNIKGNKGLAIELQNGKRFLIGTEKEFELKQLLEKTR